MRKTALFAGVFASVLIFVAGHSSTKALSFDQLSGDQRPVPAITLVTQTQSEEDAPEQPAETQPPQPVTHTVAKGESLSKVAELHQTTWRRLYDKNTEIQHPDVINVNQVLTIPFQDEVLPERPLPAAQPVVESAPTQSNTTTDQTPRQKKQPVKTAPKPSVNRVSSSGNGYVAGYCTWYAKSRRPDLPNNLGNANTWVSRARAQGIPTGSTPQVGAIGQQGTHVVYVESVNGDGTVTISEMNFKGLGVISSRTVPASYFQYIY